MNPQDTHKAEMEHQLHQFYVHMMVSAGMSQDEASTMVTEIIDEAKRRGSVEGAGNLPADYGRQLIRLASGGDSQAAAIVDRARKDGAAEGDIEEWWGLDDLQRRLVIWSESIFRLAMAENARAEGKNTEEAARIVWKMFPIYGIPLETDLHNGEDRRLAPEIRGRVDRYRQIHGAAKIIQDSHSFLTYNAFVRSQIRHGRL